MSSEDELEPPALSVEDASLAPAPSVENAAKRRRVHPPQAVSHHQRLPLTSVVKIFTKRVPEDYLSPWKRHSQHGCTGSGFIVRQKDCSGRNGNERLWVLTNAHCVHRAISVLVRRHGQPGKCRARVLCEGHGVDLALLEVLDDLGVKENENMAEIGLSLPCDVALPQLDANVACVGFPTGGEQVCVTRGVVSRIDLVEPVRHADTILSIQVDAAINPGSSGGPVFDERGGLVGMARAKLNSGRQRVDNVGYIIPACAITGLFLEEYKRTGRFSGVASLGFSLVQKLESPALRAHLKLSPEKHARRGIRVCGVAPLSPSDGVVEVNDVLLAVDGESVAEDGTIELPNRNASERVPYTYLVTRRPPGAVLRLLLLRDGVEKELELKTEPFDRLVPALDGWDAFPRFVLFGGLVFVALSLPWLEAASRSAMYGPRVTHLWPYLTQPKPKADEEIVILAKVLAHDVNVGYHEGFDGTILAGVGGEPVPNLQALATICDKAEGVIKFEVKRSSQAEQIICLDVAACRDAEKEILATNLINETQKLDPS